MDECHVYILAFSSEKIYVGVSVDPENRLNQHRKRKTSLVFHAIEKHGEPRLIRIAKGSRAECYELEEHLVDTLNTLAPNGYNLVRGGRGGLGQSEESRQRKSEAAKKRGVSDHVMAALQEGKKRWEEEGGLTTEERERKGTNSKEAWRKRQEGGYSEKDLAAFRKIGLAHKGKVVTAESRKRMSAGQTGRVMSVETRAKMSTAHKNRKPISEETRKRISEAAKKRGVPESTLEKLKLGRERRAKVPRTTEENKRNSERMKQWWKQRKLEEV